MHCTKCGEALNEENICPKCGMKMVFIPKMIMPDEEVPGMALTKAPESIKVAADSEKKVEIKPVPVPMEQEKKTKRKTASVGQRFICVLLSICLCVGILLLLLMLNLRKSLSSEGLRDFVESSLQGTQVEKLYDTVIETVTEEVSENIGITISTEEIEEVRELYYETISDVIYYTATGKGNPIDQELWKGFIENRIDDLEELTSPTIEFEGEDLVVAGLAIVNEAVAEELDSAMEEAKEEGMYTVYNLTVGTAISERFYFLIGIVAALVLLIFIIFNKYADKSFIYIGVSCIVAGGISLILVALSSSLQGIFGVYLTGLANYIGSIMRRWLIAAGGLVVGGIILAVIGNGIRKSNA